jgi:hypothetical protein
VDQTEAISGQGKPDWEDTIIKLTAIAQTIIRKKGWLRKNSEATLKGQTAKDYVLNAIGWHLQNPEKYKPELGSLVTHLANRMMTLVGDDAKRKENRLGLEIQHVADGDESTYLERLTGSIENCIEEEMFNDMIISEIVHEISNIADDKNRDILEKIYLGFESELKRRQIIKTFGMTEADYDLGFKRLKTIANRVMNKYENK